MPVITNEKSAFLKFEIENGDSRRVKHALQDLCELYRKGHQFKSEDRNSFEKTISGMILAAGIDIKAVRWGLNALARISTQSSVPYIEGALLKYSDTPEIVASAIAGLSRIFGGDFEKIKGVKSIDPAISILASLQTVDPSRVDLSKLRIDIDNCDSEVLKLSLIPVGLNRNVENIFHPRHTNREIVRALCQHGDDIVRQYSVWAIIENPTFDISDVGIHASLVEKEPPNVQSKIFQLYGEKGGKDTDSHGMVHKGSLSPHIDVREGLARGLSKRYYDGIEEVIVDWVGAETSNDVKGLLAEHIARFSDDCSPYEREALLLFEAEPNLKSRLLLGAEGTALYGKIKAMDIRSGTPDLFGFPKGIPGLGYSKMVENLQVRGGKKMKSLLLASCPIDQGRLRLDEEVRDLTEQIELVKDKKVDLVLNCKWAVRTDQIQKEILNCMPDILHFSGHGGFGNIVFEDVNGNASLVDSADISELISLITNIKCVILNCCYSESVAQEIVGCADSVVKCVIGCDSSIDDKAAVIFSRAFYRSIAHGKDYEAAFKFAKNDVSLNGYKKESVKYKIIAR